MDSPTCPFGAHSMVGGHFVVSCVSAGRAHHTSQPLQPELPSGIHPQVPQTGLLWRGARTAGAGVAGDVLDKGLGSAGDGGHARPRASVPLRAAQVVALGRGEDSERRIGSAHPARVPKARAVVICGRPPSTWGVLGTSQPRPSSATSSPSASIRWTMTRKAFKYRLYPTSRNCGTWTGR